MIVQILQNIDKAKSNRDILLVALVLVISIFNINITVANTGINPQIPYSGNIIQNNGIALSDGTYRAKFLVYNIASGGTAIYEEIRDGSTSYAGTGVSPALTVSDGRFEILLGSQNTTNFTSVLNDDSLWLELQLDMDNNGSYEEIFSPRRRLGSALYAINSLRLVAANNGTDSDTLSLDIDGNVIATSLGGVVNISTPVGFDRVLLANSSGQFSQVSLSSLTTSGALTTSTGWALAGNSTTDSWNGTSGTRLGTISAQPLVLATTNATAQDIRFFTGANGASERMRILGTGNIGIGTTTPGSALDIKGTLRLSGATSGFVGLSPAASAGSTTYTLPSADGANGQVLSTNGSGVMSWISAGASSGWALAGNSTTDAWNGSSGTRLGTTSAQPLVLATTNATAQDIRFFTGANGANERMRILSTGNIGIGTSSPTARLQLAAGTATANTAPLKLTSGSNLTTPEAGAIEWNGTNLFLTTSGNVRQTINQGLTATANLDFASTNNGSFTDLTVTVTGAALNDVVSLGIPNGSVPAANANFTAWVSAANTVTVRFNNNSGVAQDPASGSFKVFVTKF